MRADDSDLGGGRREAHRDDVRSRPRSRARRRSPARSAARSSTPPNLSHSLGLALSIVAAVAAFLLAALLALSSVGKRVRELGTLKALGWTQGKVVRQVAAESLDHGRARRRPRASCSASRVAVLVGVFGPTLTASSTTGGREPLRRRAGRAHHLGRRLALGAGRRPDRARRLRARRPRRPARRRRRRAPRRPPPPRRCPRGRSNEPVRAQRRRQGVHRAARSSINALQDVEPEHRARRVRRARGPERLRKDDAAPAPRRARPALQRSGLLRGPRPRRASRRRPRRAPPAFVRIRLPAVQPDPDADRAREHRGEAGARRLLRRRTRAERARGAARRGRPRRPCRLTCRRSSRAASSSASRSPARSRSSPA